MSWFNILGLRSVSIFSLIVTASVSSLLLADQRTEKNLTPSEAIVVDLQQSEAFASDPSILAILGFLAGDLEDSNRPNFDTYPSVHDENLVIGGEHAIPFALSVLASDQLGDIGIGSNQTGSDISITWEARLLLDGEQVAFNDPTQPNPYPDYLVLLDADGNEQGAFSASGLQTTTTILAGQSTATFKWAIRDDPSITPARALELDQLSVRLRILSATATGASVATSIRADASSLSYTLRDTTQLPLGFEFISVSAARDGTNPLLQEQYSVILANLNNAAMRDDEHVVPEGAVVQFRPRLENDGNAAPYRVIGRADKFIDIPLLFEAGTNTPRFGGAFVALRNMDAIHIDSGVVDNRCRLLEDRDPANDVINIEHTVDYCLQQRGFASANARRTLDNVPLLSNTTGTSTVLKVVGDEVSQLSLRLASGTTLNTVVSAVNSADNPFSHLLMGTVIAAPHLPTSTDPAHQIEDVVSRVVPVRQANYDLTLEPDEHFVMRWSTTDTRIVDGEHNQRRFIIRGHSPQSVLSYSERFARAEFGLISPTQDALGYIPYFEFAPPLHHSVSTVMAVPESQSIMLTLRWVGDTPMGIDARDDALHDEPLYYTDTISREFSLDIELTASVNAIPTALPNSLQIANATLPASHTPRPLELQFTITGMEDLNAINEQFIVLLARVIEVTPSLPNSISQAARTTVSTSTISLQLILEDDDEAPLIDLSYRLFDLGENPYTNTAGTLTEGTLAGYRVQGSAAIVPVARDAVVRNLLDTSVMPHFPDSLSRYRFGIDVPEHDLSLPVPEGQGIIVGRGDFLADLDNQPIDLAPHYELYAVFITPEADAFNYTARNGASDNPVASQSLSFAGLAHPHNLAQTSTAIISAAVGTRQARSHSELSAQLRAILPNSAEHIMLFARLSHHPDNLDSAQVLAQIAEDCPVIEDADALGADGNIIVSINDHRYATGSADKLAQPFSILNILGSDATDNAALYQYGFREGIATMNIALLCASDPSLSPDLNDNLNADGSIGPEYCATDDVLAGNSYCEVGRFDLNYTDYLPELFNADLVQGGASFYMHRAHNAPLYEADVNAGISAGYEGADDPTNCRNADIDPAQRCNQLSWLIQTEPRLRVGFYGTHSRSELLQYTPRVNTQADDARLQWAIAVVSTTTATTGDLTATELTHTISTGSNQDAFDNPNRGAAHLPEDLVDSLALLTAVLPSNVNTFADLSFAIQINANQRYHHCAISFTSVQQIRECVIKDIPKSLRVEPLLITRVYDSENNPALISHPVTTNTAGTSTATISIIDPDAYALLESSSSDGVLEESSLDKDGNIGKDGSFVDLSVRFGGISDTNMADRLDLALIFYTDMDTDLQLHAESNDANTPIQFFAGVTNPAKADSDLVVQARGDTQPYGGLWSTATMNAGSADTNPLALTLFADEAGMLLDSNSVASSVNLNDENEVGAHPILGTHRVLLALRYPEIAPSTEPQPLARVYVVNDNVPHNMRSVSVALGVLGASTATAALAGEADTVAPKTLDYLQITDPEDSNNTARVNTARHIGSTYLPNYLGLQEADAMAFATPVTQQLHLLDDDNVVTSISVISTPSSSNVLVEQDMVSAVHQLHLSNLDVPYLDADDTLITPSNVGVLLRLDFSVADDAHVSPNNMFFVRLRDTDNNNDNADTRLIDALGTTDDPNPVYVLLGNPNFVSDHCAGIDLSNDINPIEVGDSEDRTQDGGASLTLEILAAGGEADSDFYGDQAIVYTPYVLCSNHQLFDAHVDNRALTGHACKKRTISTLEVGTDTLEACALTDSPVIGVVETAQADIVISAELTGGSSASHDFSNNLILSVSEPDAARPAINRATIRTPNIQLRATLSDGATNRSSSTITLNHMTKRLDQFASQFTFFPSPEFSALRGIPNGAHEVVIGTLIIAEDELMEGSIDYPLLVAGATDYIVATRASAIRAEIHTELPMVDNLLTGVPEEQAAGYVFQMALDLDNTLAQTQVQNQILPTIRVVDADDYFHYLVEGPAIDPLILAGAVLNQFSEADAAVVNLRVGLGGTHIAWGGSNPTAIISEAIMREMMVQVLSDAEFNAAAFLDSGAPTYPDRSLFIHTDSTADYEGTSRDVSIELPSGAVNIVRESSTTLASYTTDQPWWRLRFGADIFAEGDEYIEIALSMRESSPTNPATPRALRRIGAASYLRYQISEPAPELFVFAKSTAISSQQGRYPLPMISEYLASDVVAGEPSAHAIVSTLAVTALPQDGMLVQLDVYGHLANRDGDLILGTHAYATDETIPQSRMGDAAQVADASVRRFYLQLGDRTPACLAGSGITAQQVFETSAPVIGTNGLIEFPIGTGARRPNESHASVHYGGTRVLRLHASVLCSDDSIYLAGTPASHVWTDPDIVNTTNTDTRGIPVLLRDRADEFTLSYFVAATDSLSQAGFTPRTQFGLHEAGVPRPFPNTLARLHIHAALIPTSAEFGKVPIIPVSDLQAPIPTSTLRASNIDICGTYIAGQTTDTKSVDCVSEVDTTDNDRGVDDGSMPSTRVSYYLGSIRGDTDANTWDPNRQIGLLGAGTTHQSTRSTSFASQWLSRNSAIALDPLPSTRTRNALLVPSAPSALFDQRIFIAPAAILSSIAPQRIMLQDAQSYVSMSADISEFSREGSPDSRSIAEFEINLGGIPAQTPVAPLTNLPEPLQIQLGFVFGFARVAPNNSVVRPNFAVTPTGHVFGIDIEADGRDSTMLTLTPTLGFDTGDSQTTSTLTIDNGHYFEARLEISTNTGLSPEQQRRVVLRMSYDGTLGPNLVRSGLLQVHLVAPPERADYYIYPEDDPIAPSAVNMLLNEPPILICADAIDSGPSLRDCLTLEALGTYAFSARWHIAAFSLENARLLLSEIEHSFYRLRYYSSDDPSAACNIPPESGPLPLNSPYLIGRHAGASEAISANVDTRGVLRNMDIDTRAIGDAGASYCVILEVSAGGSAFTLPARIDLPDYSMDDDNNNGLPDDVEIIDAPAGSNQALMYIQDYCQRMGRPYDSDLAALNDCDNDGAPDLAELQYGVPERHNDYVRMHATCIAEGFYTRFPRVGFGDLLCVHNSGDDRVARQTIARIEADWFLAIRGNDYAGVALEVASVGPPTTLRANNGLLPANRYWFVNPDFMEMIEIFLAPALRFRTPSRVPSGQSGYRLLNVMTGAFSDDYYPLSAELLGHLPEIMEASVALELEGYADGIAIATHSDEIQFVANNGLAQDIGTYRSSTRDFRINSLGAPIVSFFRTPMLSSVTATINYTVRVDAATHPLHNIALSDHRRIDEIYEIGIAPIDAFGRTGTPQPIGLQLVNILSTASLTAALPVSAPIESTLDFILREHQILTQNAGVLYLGPHPNISTPTALSAADSMAVQAVLRAQLTPSSAYFSELVAGPGVNRSETWSVAPLEDGAQEIILTSATSIATLNNPYTLPDVATLCDMLPTCTSEDGGVDYVRLLYRLNNTDTTPPHTIAMAQLWLQLGGDATQIFDDKDEDGVPETHGDIEGALSLPFSVSGMHGSIVVEQQQVALQLGFRARARYQTDSAFAQGANVGSGDMLDLDFHLSCIEHTDQAGGLFYDADSASVVRNHDILRDISGRLLDAASSTVSLRGDVDSGACLGYEVPVLIQMPESMAIASGINVPDQIAGFGVKSYSFSEGLPDGSCPQANARSDWWQPDNSEPREDTERCMRLILESDLAMAGLPAMPSHSEPLSFALVEFVPSGSRGDNSDDNDNNNDNDNDNDNSDTANGGGGDDGSGGGGGGGGGGGIINTAQLLLLCILAMSGLFTRRTLVGRNTYWAHEDHGS